MNDLLLNFRLNTPLYAPRPAFHHTSAVPYLSPSLSAAKHVYIQRDGTKGPLQRPYSGPYAVLTTEDKTFLINIDGRAERISVDRTKPAFFDLFQPVILAKPPPRGRPPARVIPHTVIHQTQAPPLSVSKLCKTLPFRRRRAQVERFGRLCDTSSSYSASLLCVCVCVRSAV